MANKISFSKFQEIEMKVGTIKEVEDHPNANKLYILTVDLGQETKTIIAGLKNSYKKEELKGKQAIFVTNLEPRKLRGIESQGMILAASTKDKSEVVFIQPERHIENGSKIS